MMCNENPDLLRFGITRLHIQSKVDRHPNCDLQELVELLAA
jgi:hypothetical protein